MKRLRFYLGVALFEAAMLVMPGAALANYGYNTNFLKD